MTGKIKEKCQCPICMNDLSFNSGNYLCEKCNASYQQTGDFFLNEYNGNQDNCNIEKSTFMKDKQDILSFYKKLFINHKGNRISSFMNYGAIFDDKQDYTFDQLSENLLQSVLMDNEFNGKRLLEVGCGRGGNLNYLAEQYDFERLIGIDFVPENIAYCSENCNKKCRFLVGDAEGFYINNYFDYVLNIESSIHYTNLNKFIENAHNCLVTGGKLLLADVILSENVSFYRNAMQSAGFFEIQEYDYTNETIKANKYKRGRLRPKYTSKVTRDDDIGKGLEDGTMKYMVFHANKQIVTIPNL